MPIIVLSKCHSSVGLPPVPETNNEQSQSINKITLVIHFVTQEEPNILELDFQNFKGKILKILIKISKLSYFYSAFYNFIIFGFIY